MLIQKQMRKSASVMVLCLGVLVLAGCEAIGTAFLQTALNSVEKILKQEFERFAEKQIRKILEKVTKSGGLQTFTVQETTFNEGADAYNADDFPKALSVWQPLAREQNYALAQNGLGEMYRQGLGVSQSYEIAVEWYQKAADQGLADAQTNLGLAYALGRGKRQNSDTAAQWWQKAVEQDYAPAQFYLGLAYYNGEGEGQNYARAIDLWSQAAEKGEDLAQFYLGVAHDLGTGVVQSHATAAEWYHKAAKNGNADAQFNLGIAYAKGEGVAQNYQTAHVWFNVASANGVELAKKTRAIMERDLLPGEIRNAQDIAQRCINSEYEVCPPFNNGAN